MKISAFCAHCEEYFAKFVTIQENRWTTLLEQNIVLWVGDGGTHEAKPFKNFLLRFSTLSLNFYYKMHGRLPGTLGNLLCRKHGAGGIAQKR